METRQFHYSSPQINLDQITRFNGSAKEKETLMETINEWNTRMSLSLLFNSWEKKSLHRVNRNLLVLLYNVEGLNTHISDVDILLSKYMPHVCILTGVGAAIRRNIPFPNYRSIS